jgi:Fic family protein
MVSFHQSLDGMMVNFYHSIMTIFRTPKPDAVELAVMAKLDEVRAQLRYGVSEPRRWSGTLRRLSFARVVQGSNTIEGYEASIDDAVAAIDDEPMLSADEATKQALSGYQSAMTYVLQLALDPELRIDEGLLRALHFMMLQHELTKHPGRWRPGAIWVRRDPSGDIVYEGPDREMVPELIAEMLEALDEDQNPDVIRAAMAHLNLVMIHPFKDGNGRMARCLQTLILAKGGVPAPVFSSIEEYLGRNTDAYYRVLGDVGQGSWNPEGDARPWVRFCLTAHYRQAATQLRRIREYEELWRRCERIAEEAALPERVIGALMDVALGLRIRNASYRSLTIQTAGEEVSEQTAGRDLRAMVEAGLLKPVGERRGRYYVGEEVLKSEWSAIRDRRESHRVGDPFDLVEEAVQRKFEFGERG